MANLVNREPEGGERTEPEEEKTDKIHCVDAGARWEGIGQVCVAGPDGSDHQRHAFAYSKLAFVFELETGVANLQCMIAHQTRSQP